MRSSAVNKLSAMQQHGRPEEFDFLVVFRQPYQAKECRPIFSNTLMDLLLSGEVIATMRGNLSTSVPYSSAAAADSAA